MMAKPLKIEEWQKTTGLVTMRISDFREGELDELKSMEHKEAVEKLLDLLDFRNMGKGTIWHNGYGVYGVWFDNEYAYVNIGNSCD